jgi:hypothetical protein
MEAKELNYNKNDKPPSKSEVPQFNPWVESAVHAAIGVAFGLSILLLYLLIKRPPLGTTSATILWALPPLVIGGVLGMLLYWLTLQLSKNKSTIDHTIAPSLATVQVLVTLTAGVAITPAGLYSCSNQGESVDWVSGRCQYVFSGKMIDASYPILGKDERTIQDGGDVVKLGTYTVKTGNGEGTIKTRNYKITENTVDPNLVGRDLDIILHSEGGWSAQVEQRRSLAGPLGGKSPEEGFCYAGKLYEAYYVNRGTRLEAKVKGACPAEDNSIPHMDNQ